MEPPAGWWNCNNSFPVPRLAPAPGPPQARLHPHQNRRHHQLPAQGFSAFFSEQHAFPASFWLVFQPTLPGFRGILRSSKVEKKRSSPPYASRSSFLKSNNHPEGCFMTEDKRRILEPDSLEPWLCDLWQVTSLSSNFLICKMRMLALTAQGFKEINMQDANQGRAEFSRETQAGQDTFLCFLRTSTFSFWDLKNHKPNRVYSTGSSSCCDSVVKWGRAHPPNSSRGLCQPEEDVSFLFQREQRTQAKAVRQGPQTGGSWTDLCRPISSTVSLFRLGCGLRGWLVELA